MTALQPSPGDPADVKAAEAGIQNDSSDNRKTATPATVKTEPSDDVNGAHTSTKPEPTMASDSGDSTKPNIATTLIEKAPVVTTHLAVTATENTVAATATLTVKKEDVAKANTADITSGPEPTKSPSSGDTTMSTTVTTTTTTGQQSSVEPILAPVVPAALAADAASASVATAAVKAKQEPLNESSKPGPPPPPTTTTTSSDPSTATSAASTDSYQAPIAATDATTTTVPKECHSELSSYIKRSLSGLFSDILQAQGEAIVSEESGGESVAMISSSDAPMGQHEDLDPTMHHAADECHGAPNRKRSRLDLEHAVDAVVGDNITDTGTSYLDLGPATLEASEYEIPTLDYHNVHDDHDPPRYEDEENPSRTLTRRRSFSYQCLNQYFDIDDDPPSKLKNPEKRQASSPRTVTGPEEHEGGSHDTPFKLPQPPLEESESMSSFIDVLGAVDLDMDKLPHEQEDAPMVSELPHPTLEPDSYGWYISAKGKGASGTKPPPLEATAPTMGIPESAVAAAAYEETTAAPGPAENVAASEADLEYAKAADTIDNVLGDLFF